MNPSSNATTITCPECLHVGERGEKDTITKIAIAQTAERSSLIKAVLPALLFLIVGIVHIAMLNGEEAISNGLNYTLLGTIVVLFIISLAMIFKYEGNRYEVYF